MEVQKGSSQQELGLNFF